ncbi:MAG: bifunctional shikimate kinase/3-dehydroquinate synthase [Solirubrobacteraceae bacterium]
MGIVFIGFMGAGKSTAAGELAAALGTRPLDSDALIERELGHSIAEEFAAKGEQSFRELEERVACGVLENAPADAAIALGGGSVLSERVRAALATHVTVLLDIDAERAWQRVRSMGDGRPLASERASFVRLHTERRALYERLADAILPAHVPRVATHALRGLKALCALRVLDNAPVGTRLLWASAASGEYPVLVGRGLLRRQVCAVPEVWPLDRERSRPLCVTDENVGSLYGDRVESVRPPIAIPPGETHKTLASAELVWSALVQAGLTRADHVVALGGGVVGDLAGFCAATYQRGVPVVHVPTTLVAQVDSAYGGKTGVDLPQAKNYVGCYHQPAGVIVDPDALVTLSAQELAAGWVEVLKTAIVAGGDLWESVSADEPLDERTILACARTKLAVVGEDERDGGRRQVLNLGHTVGHAIETVTGYARYRHGEAVGLGLLAALQLSGKEDLRRLVRGLLLAHRLPVTLGEDVDVDAVVDATMRDKKRTGAHVPFVLVEEPGELRIGCEVALDELRASVRELQG